MSALPASITPAKPRAVTPRLSVATGVNTAAVPRVSYVIATLVGIFAILLGQLVLSIALGNGAYAIQDLERQLAERNRDLSIVSEEIGAMQDPHTLATLAVSLGMVDDGDPAYLRLSDAAVLGAGEPAEAGSTSLVAVVPGEIDPNVQTAVAAIATQAGLEGESLPVFASSAEQNTEVTSAIPSSLDGVEALVPTVTPPAAEPTKNFGGSLPAPTTR